jgi:hypothetical protein
MSIAIYYLNLLPEIRKIAEAHGYAIGLHGSMMRDFDLIAAPWIEDASPAEVLVEKIRAAVNGHIIPSGTPGSRWDKEAGKFVEATIENPKAKPLASQSRH